MARRFRTILLAAAATGIAATALPACTTTPPGTISTVAGAVGSGPASSLGQRPFGVVARGGALWLTDPMFFVVRKVDLASGAETVVGGTGGSGCSGDGGPATAAQMATIYGLARDDAGRLYVADRGNHRVRAISTSDTITTIAGGAPGFSGDGGPAALAQLDAPAGVAVATGGTVFIADSGNNRIRKVAGGVITTVAGTGASGGGGDGGPATNAQLANPYGITVDAGGNVLFAELGGARVRKIDTQGIISTVAGTGTTGYSGDGGPATSAKLNGPAAVTVDVTGSLIIADMGNHRVRRVATNGTITTIAGTGVDAWSGDGGPAVSASLARPFGVTVDETGSIYVADTGNRVVRRIATNGTITTVAGNNSVGFSGDGPATSRQLAHPFSTALDGQGNLYIADHANFRIRKVAGGTVTTVAGNGVAGFAGDGGPATAAQLNYLNGIAAAGDGTLYIADTYNNRVRKAAGGTITTIAGTGTPGFDGDGNGFAKRLNEPGGVAVDDLGNVFVADTKNHRVRKIFPDGMMTTIAGTGAAGYNGDAVAATSAQLFEPGGVTVAANGEVFIADHRNHRVRKVSTNGTITTVAGDGTPGSAGDGGAAVDAQLNGPTGVAIDAAGVVFIADFLGHRIRRVSNGGVMTTVAGNGVQGSSGNGGPAKSAQVAFPYGVTVDPAGNLYVADTSSNFIRFVTKPP